MAYFLFFSKCTYYVQLMQPHYPNFLTHINLKTCVITEYGAANYVQQIMCIICAIFGMLIFPTITSTFLMADIHIC